MRSTNGFVTSMWRSCRSATNACFRRLNATISCSLQHNGCFDPALVYSRGNFNFSCSGAASSAKFLT